MVYMYVLTVVIRNTLLCYTRLVCEYSFLVNTFLGRDVVFYTCYNNQIRYKQRGLSFAPSSEKIVDRI